LAKIDRLYIRRHCFAGHRHAAWLLTWASAGDGTVRDTMLDGYFSRVRNLAVYGVIYRLWPAMKMSALARVQFWSAANRRCANDRRRYLFKAGMDTDSSSP